MVAALEDTIGTQLLQRTTRSVTITDAGMRYLERVRRILADVEDAEAAAQNERTAPVGHLVISAPLVFGRLHVSPIMSAYLKTYPLVSGELRLSDSTVNLVDEGIDLAVRIGHLPDSSVVARAVGDMRRVVVASPRYLKARGTPLKPSDLAGHDMIGSAAGLLSEWRFIDRGKEIRVPCPARFATNSVDAAIAFAEQDGGLALLLAYQVEDALKAGRLKTVLQDYETPPLPIHLVYPTSRLLSAKVRAFIDLVVEKTDWHFGIPRKRR
jgi:DNA-binding transcriptional LysR family regulator